jgi:hypothetical protein
MQGKKRPCKFYSLISVIIFSSESEKEIIDSVLQTGNGAWHHLAAAGNGAWLRRL